MDEGALRIILYFMADFQPGQIWKNYIQEDKVGVTLLNCMKACLTVACSYNFVILFYKHRFGYIPHVRIIIDDKNCKVTVLFHVNGICDLPASSLVHLFTFLSKDNMKY